MSDTTTGVRTKPKSAEYTPARRPFTTDEFIRMVEAGVLDSHERVELIEGEILLMAPIGNPHMAGVNRLNAWLTPALVGRAIVSVQNAIRLSSGSMPQPDLALFRFRQDYYATAYPRPEDIVLVIEVSDTTLRYDRDRKLPLYAKAGIPEAWIINLRGKNALIGREPGPERYHQIETVGRDGTLSPAAFPDVSIAVAALLP